MSQLTPALSVVVIGRNEGERLRRCLDSVRAMLPLRGPCEILYVDSGSTDDSTAIAAGFGARVLSIANERPTAARARNKGWRAATAPWILFLDGDTVLDPAFPGKALEAADQGWIAAVWGHRRELRPTANVFHRVLDLDWVYAPGLTEFCGGDALMRREALEAVGGFDPELIAGEEPELCARLRGLGYLIRHIDAPMTMHDLAITRWSQYWRRACRAGYAYAQMAWRTRGQKVNLWGRESSANQVRALVLMAGFVSLAVAAFVAPLAATIAMLPVVCLLARSAWRARWKSADPASLILYALHSHLQQIPIFFGQLAFQMDLSRNRRRGLIEYK